MGTLQSPIALGFQTQGEMNASFKAQDNVITTYTLDYEDQGNQGERWNLFQKPQDYPYSSAMDYIVGNQGLLPIKKVFE